MRETSGHEPSSDRWDRGGTRRALAVALSLGLLLSPFFAHNGPTALTRVCSDGSPRDGTPVWSRVMRQVTSLGSGVVVIP